jgi:pyridoxine/pyridoxamine 5'-phosphate oxidase
MKALRQLETTLSPKKQATLLDFMAANTLATIATVNNETLQPEAALIAFAELPNLDLLFITLEGSRKHVNLQTNNRIAMVIGWNPDPKRWATLQYEGLASPVNDEEDQKYRKIFSRKKDTPCSAEFLSNPKMKLYKVSPTWIGYSDFIGEKPSVIEVKDFSI